MTKLSYTILYVQDVKRSVEFYEAAFGFKRKFIAPGNSYGELDTGNTTLSFASIEQATSNLKNGIIESDLKQKPLAFEIGITTDDVEKLYKHSIKCGAIAEAAPAEKPHGPNCFLCQGSGWIFSGDLLADGLMNDIPHRVAKGERIKLRNYKFRIARPLVAIFSPISFTLIR